MKFSLIALWAASLACSGVGKSGSPAPKSTTSTPERRNRAASSPTLSVGEPLTLVVRSANFNQAAFPENPNQKTTLSI